MILIDAPDEDFSALDDNKTLKEKSSKGGIIFYTQDDPQFKQLAIPERVDYSVFLSKYDVHDKKEFAQGVEMGKAGTGIIEKVFKQGDIFAAVNRINITAMLTAFATVVFVIIAIVVIFIVNFFGSLFGVQLIEVIRYRQLQRLLKYLLGITIVTTITRFLYDRCVKRIEIIQYYI
jgi:hypothetical protein